MQFTRRRHDRSEFKICDSINQIESIHDHRDRRVRCDEYDKRKRPSVCPFVRASVTVERTETDRPMRTTSEDGWLENARSSTNAELYFL